MFLKSWIQISVASWQWPCFSIVDLVMVLGLHLKLSNTIPNIKSQTCNPFGYFVPLVLNPSKTSQRDIVRICKGVPHSPNVCSSSHFFCCEEKFYYNFNRSPMAGAAGLEVAAMPGTEAGRHGELHTGHV